MAALFDYLKEFDDIMETAVDEDGCINDEELIKRLDELEVEIPQKVDNSLSYIKSKEANAEALKAEAQKLLKRAKSMENEAHSFRDYLMRILEGRKWETAAGRVSYRKSVAVELTEDFHDERFVKYEPKISKTDIKAALKAGEIIEGATLVERQNMIIA